MSRPRGTRKLRDRLRQITETVVDNRNAMRDSLAHLVERGRPPAAKVAEHAATTSGIWDSTTDLINHLRSAPGRTIDKMFPRCIVPVYLLPTGSLDADFKLAFDFDELMSELKLGMLVRPTIEVWTGREDFNREHLAEHLRDEFVNQFNEARDRQKQSFEAELERIESRKRAARDEMIEPLAKGAPWSAGLLFDPSGITASILLLLTFSRGKKAIRPLIEWLDLSKEKKVQEEKMKRTLEELDEQFEGKNKVFRRAVSNLTVVVHPKLRTLVERFQEVDSKVFVAASLEDTSSAPPDISKFLRSPEYVASVSAAYKSVLESIT